MGESKRALIPSSEQRYDLVQKFCYVPPGLPEFVDDGYELVAYDLDATFQKQGEFVTLRANCYPSNIDFFIPQGEGFSKNPESIEYIVNCLYPGHKELDKLYAVGEDESYSAFFSEVTVDVPNKKDAIYLDNKVASIHYKNMGQTSVDFCDGITWARLYPDLSSRSGRLKYPLPVMEALLRDVFVMSCADDVFSMSFDNVAMTLLELSVDLSEAASKLVGAP